MSMHQPTPDQSYQEDFLLRYKEVISDQNSITASVKDPAWPQLYNSAQLCLAERASPQTFGLASVVAAAQAIHQEDINQAVYLIDRGLIVGGAREDCGDHVTILKKMLKEIEPRLLSAEDSFLGNVIAESRMQRSVKGYVQKLKELEDCNIRVLGRENRLEDFLEMVVAGLPCVIRGFGKGWEIVDDGNVLDKILRKNEHRFVPVETGAERYTSKRWVPEIRQLGSVIREWIKGADSPTYLAEFPLHYHFDDLDQALRIPGLLSFVEDAKAIRKSKTASDLLSSKLADFNDDDTYFKATSPLRNVWIGPAGTVSPHHTDNYSNLFVQIAGRKYFQLYPPDVQPLMTPYAQVLTNTSSIPPEAFLDEAIMTNYPTLKDLPTAQQCVLQPADALYIPKSWWHLVIGLEMNAGVSHWV